MTSIVRTITFDGPLEPVFDLVTTARFWPRWYPTTTNVAGVTERPYQLGELIREHVESHGMEAQILWHVTDHVRHVRVVLQSEAPPLRISYSFRRDGRQTELRRELEYEPATFARVAADPAQLQRYLGGQSELALKRLQELVEGILGREATDVGRVRGTRPPATEAEAAAPAGLTAAAAAVTNERRPDEGR
jgi:uncharacterized protein YndB with AHSA1/START domain